MACFLAPAVESVVVTIIKKGVRKREAEQIKLKSMPRPNIPKARFIVRKQMQWPLNINEL